MKILFSRHGHVLQKSNDIEVKYEGRALVIPLYNYEIAFEAIENDDYGPCLRIWVYQDRPVSIMYHDTTVYPLSITAKDLEILANMAIEDGDIMFDVEINKIPQVLTLKQEEEGLEKYSIAKSFYYQRGRTPYICPHCDHLINEFVEMLADNYVGAIDLTCYVCLNCGSVFNEDDAKKLERACVWIYEGSRWISRICPDSKPTTQKISTCPHCGKRTVFVNPGGSK